MDLISWQIETVGLFVSPGNIYSVDHQHVSLTPLSSILFSLKVIVLLKHRWQAVFSQSQRRDSLFFPFLKSSLPRLFLMFPVLGHSYSLLVQRPEMFGLLSHWAYSMENKPCLNVLYGFFFNFFWCDPLNFMSALCNQPVMPTNSIYFEPNPLLKNGCETTYKSCWNNLPGVKTSDIWIMWSYQASV